MGTGMNLKTSFVLHFPHVPYRLSTKGNPWLWVVREGVYRCSLGPVFNVNTCRPRLVITRWRDFESLLYGSWHRCWPMPRRDCQMTIHTQNYDETCRISWALHSQTHLFCHNNQTPPGESYVECWEVCISRIQTHTIPRFDLWALTQTTNTEENNASSFEVSYQIWGLWQYLKDITAQKAHNGSFP